MTTRLIRLPPRPDGLLAIELREHGGAVALFRDGREELFLFESQLLETFCLSWVDLQRLAEADEPCFGWTLP